MLELMIVIFPGILAFLIYRRLYRELQWKKILFYILFYVAAANLCILAGLKLIGMQQFNLFEMSVNFKLKWIVLEFVLSLVFAWIIRNISKQNLGMLRKTIRSVFPAALFFVVTYAIYTPSSLFLGNIDEFSLRYRSIIPVLFCMSLILFIGIYFVAICLVWEKACPFYISLIFSIAVGAYVQGNFLNPKLPILDGTLIEWKAYRTENIISTVFWIFCIILILIITYYKKEKFEKWVKYISYFLSAVQLVSLIVLLVTNQMEDRVSYGFSKEGEFAVGLEKNIVIFVIDTLQADVMEEYFMSDAYEEDGSLDDFTFYDNAVSGGAPTTVAMPVLLTGIEYDPMQARQDYSAEIWEETQLYDDLHQNGYDVRVYSTSEGGEEKSRRKPLTTILLLEIVGLMIIRSLADHCIN